MCVGCGQNGDNDCLNKRDKQLPINNNVFFSLEFRPKERFVYTQTKEKESRSVWTPECAHVQIVKKKRRCKAARKAKENNAFRMWNPLEYKVF